MIRRLAAHEWPRARALRVRALRADPGAFGSTVAREQGLAPAAWEERLTGSAWLVADDDAGLVVLGRDDDGGRALLSLWVDPAARGTGLADALVRAALARAPGEPVRRWVVEEGVAAQRLYARHGFAPTGRRAPLPSAPGVVQVELARLPTGPYDRIGTSYTRTRRPDPRIAAQLVRALGDARTVVDVGAGTGSYEVPATVLAVEPSRTMLGQRPAGAAPAVQAVAEALPLPDDAVDAATAVLTVHHWTDVRAGLAELRRVARRRVVVLTWDQAVTRELWLLREYLPQAAALDDARAVPVQEVVRALGGARVEVVPVPHDCADGFAGAFWRRPEAYLDPQVRAGMSVLAQTGEDALAPGLARLADDLASGAWHARHADLLAREELDCGYRLVVAELPGA